VSGSVNESSLSTLRGASPIPPAIDKSKKSPDVTGDVLSIRSQISGLAKMIKELGSELSNKKRSVHTMLSNISDLKEADTPEKGRPQPRDDVCDLEYNDYGEKAIERTLTDCVQ